MNFSSFYLVGAFVGYLEGLGQPFIILWSINSMFNVLNNTLGTSTFTNIKLVDFQQLIQSELYLVFQSVIFCSFATYCLTRYLLNRTKPK